MYLLDTNVVSELRRPKPHGGVVAWLTRVADEDLHVSALTLGELQTGIEITRQQNPDRARELEAWVDRVGETYNILAIDGRTCRTWAKLLHGRSDELFEDAMIAATALVHHLTVVTRNVRDFEGFGVPTLNPFTARRS